LKKTACFFIFFFVLLGCNRKAETNLSTLEKTEIDSLLEKANDFSLTKSTRLYNVNKAYGILKQREDSASISYLFKIADRFYNAEDTKMFIAISRNISKMAIAHKDSANIAKSLNYIADYYYYSFKNDSAYYYYTKAELIYNQLGKNESRNRIAFNKASILLYEKNFSQSETDIIKVLRNANLENDHRLIYDCYLTLGMASRGMNNNLTAISYYEKAFKQTDSLKDNPQYDLLKAQPLNYSAIALQKEGQFMKAKKNCEQALNFGNFRINDPTIYCYFTNTLAYSKFKLGDSSCLEQFKETLKIGDSLQSIPIQLTSKLYLAEYYLFEKDTLKAKQYSDEVLQLAHKNKVFEDELKALELLAKIDPKNDSEYNKHYIALNDSLQNIERATRNKFARIEFETDEIISQKKLVEAEKERISAQRWLILGLGLFLIIVLVLLFIAIVQRSKNKELMHIHEQQKANEEIYRLMLDQQQKIEEGKQIEKRRISKELHDGVMGKLTAIRLNLFVLNKRNDPETIAKCIEHVNEIQNIEKEIRKISHDLNQNLFADVSDFSLMVNNLMDGIKEHSDINFKLITDEKIDWNTINSSVKMQVYRILQEALHNIEKYAQAKNVSISMLQKDVNLTVSVTDDGIGFDTEVIKSGIGHKNMKERAAEINGKLTISSENRKGTKINLIIPT
jgi:signal transduction histidine kinase